VLNWNRGFPGAYGLDPSKFEMNALTLEGDFTWWSGRSDRGWWWSNDANGRTIVRESAGGSILAVS
jgi:hypothetical protein